MENWQKDLITLFDQINTDFEEFCSQMIITVETITEDVTEEINNFMVEIERNFNKEIDDVMQEIDYLVLELLQPLIEEEQEELDQDFYGLFEDDNPTITPNSEQHPACVGCRNYHGQVYNGNLLVCGMHPYGWDAENCPDWEKLMNNE